MIVGSMGKMMEKLAPSSVCVLEPGRSADAVALQRRVYAQMRRDFMVASPFVLHAQIPELLAASWALVRETLFCGDVGRDRKELVAWAVSDANQCPSCIDAHHAAVQAADTEVPAREQWARATARANSNELRQPPFAEAEAAEYLGAAVAFTI